MASRQAKKEEKTRLQNEPQHDYRQETESKESGILGNIMKSVGDKYDQVKEAVSSKTYDTDVRTGQTEDEYKDYDVEKSRERKDYTEDKGKETKDSAMDKTKEYTDYTVEKASEPKDDAEHKGGEYKDETAEKANEETEAVSGRMAELKESAGAAARRAMEFLTGGTEEIDRKALQGGDINEKKYGETEPEAREKMREVKLNEDGGGHDEAKQRDWADWETAADRGIAARRNIYGAAGTVKDAIKDKLTYPTDIVQEARASREYGGPKRGRGDKLVDEIEGPTGAAAFPSLRTSD